MSDLHAVRSTRTITRNANGCFPTSRHDR
jgi:hypothetical protein